MGARCIGVVIFAAPAAEDGSLSPFMQEMHTRWEHDAGATVQAINEVRREEERQAMRILGLEPLWLDFPDAPYRRSASGEHLYNSDQKLFGTIAAEERRTLVPRVAEEIRRVARDMGARGRVRVFAPLGIGRHVDHQIVFQSARRLGPRYGVLHYEDYPYVAKANALQTRMQELNFPMQPRLTPISDLIGVKIAAIARYKSQVGVLFGSPEAMPAQVRAYAQSISGSPSGYAERFWYAQPSYVLG
jgi:LmbE family N-acetylglucosaminyl deacetylase